MVSQAATQVAADCGCWESTESLKQFSTGFLDAEVINLIPSAYELKIRLDHFLTSLKWIVQCNESIGYKKQTTNKDTGLSRLPMFMNQFNDLNSPSSFM